MGDVILATVGEIPDPPLYPQRRGGGGRPPPPRGSRRPVVITESGIVTPGPTGLRFTSVPTTSTTATPPLPCDGNITLYSSTYHRGDNVTIHTDTDNLLSVNFDNKLVSVSVSACCWNIFTDPFYSGDRKKFLPGETYRSISSVGRMFRAASSIQKTPC